MRMKKVVGEDDNVLDNNLHVLFLLLFRSASFDVEPIYTFRAHVYVSAFTHRTTIMQQLVH